MLFHTWVFLLFCLVFFPVYLVLRKRAYRLPWREPHEAAARLLETLSG